MNEPSLCQRLGDGTDPTVMSLQRQGEERELYETSHSFICLFPSLCAPVLLSCDGLILQASDSSPLLSYPSPTRDAPLLSSPALSRPTQPCLFQSHGFWLQPQEILISRPCSGAQAKKFANLVHVCVCLYACQFNNLRCRIQPFSKAGLRPGHKGRAVKVHSLSVGIP